MCADLLLQCGEVGTVMVNSGRKVQLMNGELVLQSDGLIKENLARKK